MRKKIRDPKSIILFLTYFLLGIGVVGLYFAYQTNKSFDDEFKVVKKYEVHPKNALDGDSTEYVVEVLKLDNNNDGDSTKVKTNISELDKKAIKNYNIHKEKGWRTTLIVNTFGLIFSILLGIIVLWIWDYLLDVSKIKNPKQRSKVVKDFAFPLICVAIMCWSITHLLNIIDFMCPFEEKCLQFFKGALSTLNSCFILLALIYLDIELIKENQAKENPWWINILFKWGKWFNKNVLEKEFLLYITVTVILLSLLTTIVVEPSSASSLFKLKPYFFVILGLTIFLIPALWAIVSNTNGLELKYYLITGAVILLSVVTIFFLKDSSKLPSVFDLIPSFFVIWGLIVILIPAFWRRGFKQFIWLVLIADILTGIAQFVKLVIDIPVFWSDVILFSYRILLALTFLGLFFTFQRALLTMVDGPFRRFLDEIYGLLSRDSHIVNVSSKKKVIDDFLTLIDYNGESAKNKLREDFGLKVASEKKRLPTHPIIYLPKDIADGNLSFLCILVIAWSAYNHYYLKKKEKKEGDNREFSNSENNYSDINTDIYTMIKNIKEKLGVETVLKNLETDTINEICFYLFDLFKALIPSKSEDRNHQGKEKLICNLKKIERKNLDNPDKDLVLNFTFELREKEIKELQKKIAKKLSHRSNSFSNDVSSCLIFLKENMNAPRNHDLARYRNTLFPKIICFEPTIKNSRQLIIQFKAL